MLGMTVYWEMNPILRLNLTFLSFYLSGASWNELNIIQSKTLFCSEEPDIIFWGHYSTFYFYSKKTRVSMCILDRDGVQTQIHFVGVFMIFDSDQFYNSKSTDGIYKNRGV